MCGSPLRMAWEGCPAGPLTHPTAMPRRLGAEVPEPGTVLGLLLLFFSFFFGRAQSLLLEAGFFSSCVRGATLQLQQALEHRSSSYGTRASLPRGMWHLPGLGVEPMSPASAGGFLTTEPPGSPGAASCVSHLNPRVLFTGLAGGPKRRAVWSRRGRRTTRPWSGDTGL